MALSGTAFLCLWNDIDPALGGEYERWHTQEHVPERVAAPGFLSGRRYGAFDRPEDRYLTLYDLDGMEALETPEYADLQKNPTRWSARMRPHFMNVLRIPFERVASEGEGCAGHVSVFAFETDVQGDESAQKAAEALSRRRDAGISVAFHIGQAVNVPAYDVFGLPAETGAERRKVIAIEEVTTADQAAEGLRWMRSILPAKAAVTRVLRAETTALLFSVCHDDVVARWRRSSVTAGRRLQTGA